jgi:hypothetical protein
MAAMATFLSVRPGVATAVARRSVRALSKYTSVSEAPVRVALRQLVSRVGEPAVVSAAREVSAAMRVHNHPHLVQPEQPPLRLTPVASKLLFAPAERTVPAAPAAAAASAVPGAPAAECSSVLKKRRMKMNKHKHKKWLKKMKFKLARAKKQSA